MAKKAPLDLEEALIKEEANAHKILEEDTLREAVRKELTALVAKKIAKQVVAGDVGPPSIETGSNINLDRLSIEDKRALIELLEKAGVLPTVKGVP